MQNDKALQEDLDRAQADLEVKVGQLKAVVMDKLETPKRVVSGVEATIAFMRAHPALIAGAVAGILLGPGLFRLLRGRHATAHRHRR